MIKLLILDIDGVMCKNKTYDKDHNVIGKQFCDIDFTAIKRFQTQGVRVIVLSGDRWNETMSEKRGMRFFCSRDKKRKSDFANTFEFLYDVSLISEAIYIGDDVFDIGLFDKVAYPYCPSNTPEIVRTNATSLKTNRGEGCVAELYDVFKTKMGWSDLIEELYELDSQQQSTKDML